MTNTSAPPFEGYIPIREKLNSTEPNDIVSTLISRKDGLNHLLLTDVNNLINSIAYDFKNITKVYSIGKSFEGRDINVIELDTSIGESKAAKVDDGAPLESLL